MNGWNYSCFANRVENVNYSKKFTPDRKEEKSGGKHKTNTSTYLPHSEELNEHNTEKKNINSTIKQGFIK